MIKGVKIKKDPALFLQEKGVVVNPHIGRLRRKFHVPKKILGIKNNDAFFTEYVNGSTFTLLSKKEENNLSSIENSVRMKVKKLAIGYDGKYMPVNVYTEDFLPYFEKKKEEYFEERDRILDDWDNIVKRFKKELETFLDNRGLTTDEKNELKKEIYSSIPKKEQFKNSFRMDIGLSAFPVAANLSILDSSISDEIKDSIMKESLKSLYEIMGTIMADAFSSINIILAYYNENGTLSKKYSSVLVELKKRLVKNNILKHPLVDKIVEDIKEIQKMEDEEDIISSCEIILSKIYVYAEEVEVEDALDLSKSELDEKTLKSIYNASMTTAS